MPLCRWSFSCLLCFLCLGLSLITPVPASQEAQNAPLLQGQAPSSEAKSPSAPVLLAASEDPWEEDSGKEGEDVWGDEPSSQDQDPWAEDPTDKREDSPWDDQEPSQEAPPWDTEKAVTDDLPPWEQEKAEAASPISFSGHFWTRYGNDINEETPYEYDGTSHTELRLKAAYNPGPNWYALFALDANAFLYRNGSDWYDDLGVRPHEAFVRYSGPSYEISLGNQLVKWGKADEVSPLDNVNPEDLRGGFVRSRESRKLAVPMLNIKFFKDVYRLEALFIPFFRRSKLDLVGRDWALFTHLDREVRPFEIVATKPANNLSNSEFGLRFAGTVRKFDYALSFLHTREDIPSFDSLLTPPGFRVPDPDGVELRHLVEFASNPLAPQPIRLQYRRQNVLGFEFETTWKSLGVRGELAYLRKRSFLDDRLRRVEIPVWSYVLGVDYNKPGSFYVNLQFGHRPRHQHS